MAKGTNKQPEIFYELWFPKNTQSITIVGPPSYDELKDASLTSPNYALLDNLGDRDSIYAIGKLLSRKYPHTLIDLRSSKDFDSQSLRKNLVIVGGPGGSYDKDKEELEGNEVCRIFSESHINTKISYSDDCESLILENHSTYKSQYDSKGHMTGDYGYFSAFQNPLLSKTRVIMLHGIHTLGVLGATRIFDGGESDCVDNLSLLKKFFDQRPNTPRYNFETFFKVKVTKGEVSCPVLEEGSIFLFGVSTSSELRKIPGNDNQMDAQMIKDELIDLITIASDNTDDNDRKKEHSKLIEKIKKPENSSISLLQNIRQYCLSNRQIPESKIEKINSLLK